MSWANNYIEKLQAGETVKFRPHGKSMSGRIESGDLVGVEPATADSVNVNDIVLCKCAKSMANNFYTLSKLADQMASC